MSHILADGGGALLVAGLIALICAMVGGALTTIGPWYDSLKFPDWKPPDWVFPAVWTVVFTLTAVAAAIAWNAAPDETTRRALIIAFAINVVLNMAWSYVFFTLRRPDWALIEVAIFWISIVAVIAVASRSSTVAAALLAPYLVWVTIASALNLAIVRRNGPFSRPS